MEIATHMEIATRTWKSPHAHRSCRAALRFAVSAPTTYLPYMNIRGKTPECSQR
jgi:hypothetical protein